MTTPELESIETITARLQAGHVDAAERSARARLERHPEEPQATLLLAVALGMQNRVNEALSLYKRLTELEPMQPAHWSNLATAQREINELVAAEANYRHALKLEPGNPVLLSNLGVLRWQRGDAVETRDLMLAAFRLDPSLPEPRIYGALASYECAETSVAENLLADHAQWLYLGPVLEPDLAAALMQLGRTVEAEQRLRFLIQRHPEAAPLARLRLVALLERVNRLDDAEAMLAALVPGSVDREEEFAARAALAARRGRHAEAVKLYRSHLQGSQVHVSRAPQWFALAKACDAAGDVLGAMQALAKAHELQLQHATQLVPELLVPDAEPLNIVRYRVDAGSHARWLEDPAAPSAAKSPIFVLGFPRSGTTLLEQMLDAHPGLQAMDERAFLQDVIEAMQSRGLQYPDDLDRLSEVDLDRLRSVYWKRVAEIVSLAPDDRLVDKNPLNMLRLPMIHRLFPHARIVLALRHPCDVILSNFMQSYRAPAFQVLCASLDRLARGYVNAMQFWLHHADLFRPAVLELRYEDLLADFATQSRRVATHLDLSDVDAMAKFQAHARAKGFISTPSYAQVVEPLNTKAVGRWQRYREYLEPVLPVLLPMIERWGYTAE
ncbi:MAG: sulfotransferase [Xanthomonadaceae bacterium]|nr:sulfotransferase [Xanthomonadaceae bacterium]